MPVIFDNCSKQTDFPQIRGKPRYKRRNKLVWQLQFLYCRLNYSFNTDPSARAVKTENRNDIKLPRNSERSATPKLANVYFYRTYTIIHYTSNTHETNEVNTARGVLTIRTACFSFLQYAKHFTRLTFLRGLAGGDCTGSRAGHEQDGRARRGRQSTIKAENFLAGAGNSSLDELR